MVFAIGKGLYYKGVGRVVVHNCRFLFKRKELMSARNRKKQPSQILKFCFFSDSFELYEIIMKKNRCLQFLILAI